MTVAARDNRGFQGFMEGYRVAEVSEGYRGLWKVTGSWKFQRVTEVYGRLRGRGSFRGLQRFMEGYGVAEVSEGYRGLWKVTCVDTD